MDQFDKAHHKQLKSLLSKIEKRFDDAIMRLSRIIEQSGVLPNNRVVENELTRFQNEILKDIRGAVVISWERGEDKLNQMVLNEIKGKISKTAAGKFSAWQSLATKPAYNQFMDRMEKGLNLSERVWQYSNDIRVTSEIVSVISKGRPAPVLAKEIKQYLKEPDKLFRRVRDEQGKLQLSKAAKEYHPGKGVYRSSYKNAMRVARTEINMSYRRAENARRMALPFVRGFRVNLSAAHPVYDICDELKGDYPKTFVWGGWHPQCICYTTAILASRIDFEELQRCILSGKPMPDMKQLTKVPDNFNKWVKDNMERSKGWKNQPYFIQDNFHGGNLFGGLKI